MRGSVLSRIRHLGAGWPLATQLIVLMAVTLVLAQVVNFLVLVVTPPRPFVIVPLNTVVKGFDTLIGAMRAAPQAAWPAIADRASTATLRYEIVVNPDFGDPPEGVMQLMMRRTAQRLNLAPSAVTARVHGISRYWRSFNAELAEGGAETLDMMPIPIQAGILVQLNGDTWLEAQIVQGLGDRAWLFGVASLLIAAVLTLVPAAILFARWLSAPIKHFASAAEELGRNPRAPLLAEAGPSELRKAIRSFNRMQQRLQRFVSDRTLMLGAISHDLRTPIQRMRYRVELVPEPERARFNADLDEIEAMISATLAFVREDHSAARREPLDLNALVGALCADAADAGQPVQMGGDGGRIVVKGDPIGLRRIVMNLIDNAVKYGGGAEVEVSVERERAIVAVRDNGPGIPQDSLEDVFQPFRRLEASRNKSTGGTGLGLAIARTTARAHGGDVILRNLPHGGLMARLELPI
ncbi:MAG: HAMP domain-containing protein [Alphaproteobacteria bacterium]|nr:HAMP domain-containing protein [Alphaproteobacteria bacterium]